MERCQNIDRDYQMLVGYGQLDIKLECLYCQKAWSHACMHKGVLSIRLIFQDRIYDPAHRQVVLRPDLQHRLYIIRSLKGLLNFGNDSKYIRGIPLL